MTLHSWTSSISRGSTSSTTWVQLLIVARSGTRPPASMAVPAAIRSSDAEPVDSASEVMASPASTGCSRTVLARASGCLSWAWPKVTSSGPPLAACRAAGQRLVLGVDQRLVGVAGAAHGLGRVVDDDVQRAGGVQGIGQRHHLGGVAQVDADDPQPVQPVAAVLHGGEAARGVLGEAGGDGGVGAVAEQPQRDVHADLRPAAGEQRTASGQVRPGVPLAVAERGALRAQLVVEGVHLGVVLLADVAGPGPDEVPGDARPWRTAPACCRGFRRRSGPGPPSRSGRSRRGRLRRSGPAC